MAGPYPDSSMPCNPVWQPASVVDLQFWLYSQRQRSRPEARARARADISRAFDDLTRRLDAARIRNS